MNSLSLGRSASSNTEMAAGCVDAFIHADQWLRLQELYTELEISYGAIFYIVHDVLQYWKAKAQREPKGLMDKHRLEKL
jgi:hypothetical protein